MKLLFRLIISILIIVNVSYATSDKTLGTTGKIAGRVTDSKTGEPIPFVNVIVMGSNMGSATDIDGYYSIINVPPGIYEVKASAIGYNAQTIQNVRVSIDLTTSIDFQLSDVSFQLDQEVVVIATKPMIQKDITATTSIVGDDLISSLPVTEISDVLQLQAGITVSGGNIHIRGGRSGQIAYQIDGVPITDSYDGSNIVDVNASAVQELQVISGAFNAEYGQAMSGVVNLVTKDGSNNFNGSITTYFGDYFSTKKDIFWNIDKFNLGIENIEGSISGPIIKDKFFFFINGRHYYNEGYIYGHRIFKVTDKAVEIPNVNDYNITQSGDSAYVPMNPNERWYGQAKLTYRILPEMRLSYNYMVERQHYKHYNGARLTPDNNLNRFRNTSTNIVSINHAISNNSFYTFNFSYYFKNYHHYLFENMHEGNSTFYIDNRELQTPPYSYGIGGTDGSRFTRNSATTVLKLDWATQFTQEINVQFGGEFKQHVLYFHDINLQPKLDANGIVVTPYDVDIPPITSPDHNQYTKKPYEGAAYVQAKFEAFNLIFNAGVRFDMFNSNGKILRDPTDPNINNPLKPDNQFFDYNGNGIQDPGEPSKTVADRLEYWYDRAPIKYQLSPRLGLAFPITETGVIHFSYGHFFQLPSYEFMYQNYEFEVSDASGNVGLLGNADLKPQQTVKGEIGLQQQLTETMVIDVSVFFEDFRNLTGTQNSIIDMFGGARFYDQYSNTDFGFSKGFIIKLSQRFSEGFTANIDYTYSVTKGNASNPADARNASLGGALPETYIAPLNWDQTHTLNFSVSYSKANDYGFSLVGNFFTGQPYTPQVNKNTRVTQNAFPRNSEYKPVIFNLDIRIYKDFQLPFGSIQVFAKVFNILDMDNPHSIYGDTGDPYFTFAKYEAEKINPRMYYNTLDQLFTNPGFFSEPRRIEMGLSYNF
ncbi:MAG: TonB-dependent receptor [Ignavibacteriales bacterium]|nr:TonB-dependent receptor [Ignavibacteriales bacterium]